LRDFDVSARRHEVAPAEEIHIGQCPMAAGYQQVIATVTAVTMELPGCGSTEVALLDDAVECQFF
jgi:hypothetical protein